MEHFSLIVGITTVVFVCSFYAYEYHESNLKSIQECKKTNDSTNVTAEQYAVMERKIRSVVSVNEQGGAVLNLGRRIVKINGSLTSQSIKELNKNYYIEKEKYYTKMKYNAYCASQKMAAGRKLAPSPDKGRTTKRPRGKRQAPDTATTEVIKPAEATTEKSVQEATPNGIEGVAPKGTGPTVMPYTGPVTEKPIDCTAYEDELKEIARLEIEKQKNATIDAYIGCKAKDATGVDCGPIPDGYTTPVQPSLAGGGGENGTEPVAVTPTVTDVATPNPAAEPVTTKPEETTVAAT